MAAIQLEDSAHYVKHASVEAETEDHEDHTFCGIMVDVVIKEDRPVEFVEISSLWVRGYLGPITVWATRGGLHEKHEDASQWTMLYEQEHRRSMRNLVELQLAKPLICRPGERYGLYVHSKRQDDMAIVYDNMRGATTLEDPFIRILPGLAHLSPVPFSSWEGAWWGCWRDRRCFVGKVSFGVRYFLWNPKSVVHPRFPQRFRGAASSLFQVHAFSWTGLPAAVVLYILNMCPWDWFGVDEDAPDTLVSEAVSRATARMRAGARHVSRLAGFREVIRAASDAGTFLERLTSGVDEDDDDDEDEVDDSDYVDYVEDDEELVDDEDEDGELADGTFEILDDGSEDELGHPAGAQMDLDGVEEAKEVEATSEA